MHPWSIDGWVSRTIYLLIFNLFSTKNITPSHSGKQRNAFSTIFIVDSQFSISAFTTIMTILFFDLQWPIL